ncbi:unnamed protein product [Urochloa decumbens]|uniref:Uncharacterized protein n=1 Tax=Urochloa decumbens TaxID=240449 RepID=A0ABC9CST5_9POAL
MAPPLPAAWPAAGDPADAEPLEVRCAGCGETLEVDRGLTEFICPDCATPQSLPPELMPPPPPRRKALPLPRGAADVRGARLPCGACGALLSVPVGLPRCACPLCGAELAVDTARLRHYLLSSAAAADAVPVVPLGSSSSAPPILQTLEAQTEHPNRFIPEQAESEHPNGTVDGEEVHGVNEDTARYKEQRNIYSGGPRIVSAENRCGEPLNQVMHQVQDLPSSHAVRTKHTYQESSDRVSEALQNSASSAPFRESGCFSHLNDTTTTDINGTAGRSHPKIVNLEKRNMQTPKQIIQKPQKQLSCHVTLSEHPSRLIPEQAESEHPNGTVDGEEVHGVNEDTARYKEQRNIYSGGPRIVSAENRCGEPLNQVRHQVQDLPSSHAARIKHTYQKSSDRVSEALQNSASSAAFRESGRFSHLNDTTTTDINGTAGRSHPKSVNLEKRNMQTPKQIMQKPQQVSCHVTLLEHAQPESANRAIRVQEKQQEPGNEANHRENARTRLANEAIADKNNRSRTRQLIALNTMGAEKRQGQTPNDATQQVQKEQFDSVIRGELDNQVTLVENEQPGRHRVHRRKRKGLIAASDSGFQLRRSKRLAKDSSATIDRQPVRDTELLLRQTVEHQAASPNGLTPIATIDDEWAESEPDEQWTASPGQHLSDLTHIDRIITNLCTSPSPLQEIRPTSSNELENLHSTPIPSSNPDISGPEHFSSNPDMSDPENFSSNTDMSDPEHFALTYIPMEVRRALAKLSSKSLLDHMISRPNSGESYLHDSMDSEGQELQLASQNKGRRPRGSTLCLKLWTMPKGMRVPVPVNASGLPIGKESARLSSFLGMLARDGILAPLSHLDWKSVPKKNKDAMCHIVKLKFDIAPVSESWIVKSLGKLWKSWKSKLKQKHFDTHETEEERLADRNPRVLEEQWRFLVAYWSTEKAQAASTRNKACQANASAFHTSGTKSFARRIEEERQKRLNDDDEPTVEDLFILTHTPKDGKPMAKVAADTIERFREQCQKQTEGSGSGSRPSRRRRKPALKASLRDAMEAKRRAEDEAATLRKKLIAMEERQKRLQEGNANMMGADGPVNYPEELAGEPSSPPGFSQVQNSPSYDEVLEPYRDLSPLYNPSA